MRNIALSIILLIAVPALWFSSCAKVDDDDTENPVIEYFHMNVNDTISFIDTLDEIRKTILLNDSLNTNHQIDTLVVGKWIYFAGRFTDNEALSSFKVELDLNYKSMAENVNDSLLLIAKGGRNIFGEKDIIVNRNRLVQITDTIQRTRYGVVEKFALEEGDYTLRVVCMDKAGNKDSKQSQVRIIRRKDIIDANQK